MDVYDKATILSEVWLTLRDAPQWIYFVTYNDAGLPLAFALTHNLIHHLSEQGEEVINESFELLCSTLRLPVGIEYYDLDDMLSMSQGPFPIS